MAEYVIVCAGLMMSLLAIGNADCGGDGNTTTCASRLLTVLHDNYDGYSSSISGVQQYGEYAAKGAYDPDSDGGGNGSGNDGTGGTIDNGLNPDGLTDVNQITSSTGSSTFGNLQADGTVLDANGEIIGTYSDTDNTFTDNDGNTVSALKKNIVQDEEGNILNLKAVTSCTGLPSPSARPVYSWAYVSKASGKVFNSLNKNELDIGDLCPQASFKIVNNGKELGGRILNSEYYAAVFTTTVSDTALNKTGEVVYWKEFGTCSVMALGWEEEIDPDDSDEDKYIARVALFSDRDPESTSYIGEMDKTDYLTQTIFDGAPSAPNDCPTTRVISEP